MVAYETNEERGNRHPVRDRGWIAPRARGESIAGFDLVTRRARLRGVLRRSFVLDSCDGATVTVLDPDGMADIDVTGDEPRELWRELADGRWEREATTTATGTRLWPAGDQEVRRKGGHVATAPAPVGARHVVSGDVEGLVDPDGPRVTLRRDGRPAAVVELPAARTLRVRAHADVASVWAPDGRVVAVDLATRAAVANLTVCVSA